MRIVVLSQRSVLSSFVISEISKKIKCEFLVLFENSDDKALLKKKLMREIRSKGFFLGFCYFVMFFFQIPLILFVKKIESNFLWKNLKCDCNLIDKIDKFEILNVNNPNWIIEYKINKSDIILVVGTRIISTEIIEILKNIEVTIINWHSGLTPKYRGVQSELYSIVNNEPKSVGSTLHYVNSGIDTGAIIKQRAIDTSQLTNRQLQNYMYMRVLNARLFVDIFLDYLDELEMGMVNVESFNLPRLKVFSTPSLFLYAKCFYLWLKA